jgi:TRAP-type C4-dicarboxylate transport system permease small subunit
MKKLRRVVRLLEKTEDSIVILSVALALMLCCIQVTARYVFNYPLSWPEELDRYLIILIVYVGASVALRKKSHIAVDLVPTFFPRSKRLLDFISRMSGIVFSLLIIIYGAKFVRSLVISGQIAITLKIPIFIVYSVLPLGGILLLFHYILEITGADLGEGTREG